MRPVDVLRADGAQAQASSSSPPSRYYWAELRKIAVDIAGEGRGAIVEHEQRQPRAPGH
jgi:hypothetical protein